MDGAQPQPAARTPTLHEIANMAGAGRAAVAVRQHYDRKFGLEITEDPGAAHPWRVEVRYTEKSCRAEAFEVRADNEDQAVAIARVRFDDSYAATADEVEIDAVAAQRLAD